jgi:hypothetical protein
MYDFILTYLPFLAENPNLIFCKPRDFLKIMFSIDQIQRPNNPLSESHTSQEEVDREQQFSKMSQLLQQSMEAINQQREITTCLQNRVSQLKREVENKDQLIDEQKGLIKELTTDLQKSELLVITQKNALSEKDRAIEEYRNAIEEKSIASGKFEPLLRRHEEFFSEESVELKETLKELKIEKNLINSFKRDKYEALAKPQISSLKFQIKSSQLGNIGISYLPLLFFGTVLVAVVEKEISSMERKLWVLESFPESIENNEVNTRAYDIYDQHQERIHQEHHNFRKKVQSVRANKNNEEKKIVKEHVEKTEEELKNKLESSKNILESDMKDLSEFIDKEVYGLSK